MDAQYTHKHPAWGALLRVLGPAEGPPGSASVAEVAARPTRFVVFFPLGPACARGIATILGNAPIPTEAQAFPVFRSAHRDPATDAYVADGWWLWDGERQWPVGRLSEDQYRLPIRQVVNDTELVARAIAGWSAEIER